MPQAIGSMADAAARQVRAGKLLGIPFSVLRDQQLEAKLIMVSAVALFVTRFFPMMKGGDKLYFSWSGEGGDVFRLMIFPMILAAVYGFIAFAPEKTKRQVPSGLLRWLPFAGAFLATGLLTGALPWAFAFTRIMPDGYLVFCWTFPALAFGLVTRLQNPEDSFARILLIAGGLGAFLGGMIEIKDVFHFKDQGFFIVLHNLLFFVVLLLSLVAVAFGADKWVPALAPLEPFAALVASALVAWPAVSMILGGLGVVHHTKFVNFILMLPHMVVSLVCCFGLLMLMAPEALDAIKKMLGQPMPQQGMPMGMAAQQPMAQPGVPPHIAQQLAELDAAWARGGMSPDEYHQRRNAILGQPR
jgi:hypothetical protein